MKTFLVHFACLALLFSTHVLRAVEAEPSAVFSGAQGSYAGNVQTGDGNFLNAGALIVLLEATGRFSANLNWQGIHYPFFGKFDAGTATFHHQFNDHSEPGSTLVLDLTLNAGARTIDCNLVQNGGSITSPATGQLSGALPDSAASQAYGGTMNTCFINPPGYGNTPQDIPGDGFSIARIGKAKGNPIRVVGRLPDTAPFACGSLLRGTTFSVFHALYHNTHGFGGLVFGQFDASDPSSLNSILLWAKRAGADPNYYPAGFNTGVGLITIGYGKSVAVHSIPHISTAPGPVSATLTLTDGNLGKDASNMDIVITAQIKIGFFSVKIFAPNPHHITVHTDAAGATWAGTFIHPVSGRLTTFHGGFTEAHNGTDGEGRGNFKGSVARSSADLPESGSARITVNP